MPRQACTAIDRQIGRRIRTCRILRGVDQKQLAKTIGISPYRLNRYETAQSQIPAPTLNDIAKEFGVPFECFLVGIG